MLYRTAGAIQVTENILAYCVASKKFDGSIDGLAAKWVDFVLVEFEFGSSVAKTVTLYLHKK